MTGKQGHQKSKRFGNKRLIVFGTTKEQMNGTACLPAVEVGPTFLSLGGEAFLQVLRFGTAL